MTSGRRFAAAIQHAKESTMETNRFDDLSRVAAGVRDRRGMMRLLLGGALGLGGLAAVTAEGRAAPRKKHHHHHHHHGGGGGDRCAGPTGICNADPTPCGSSATGETCGCELSVEGTTFCADGANPCANAVECTSTNDNNDPTSCRSQVGFHFFCQEAKACGCGVGTPTGRVCVAECDNPGA
jgi:hypothetical protein